jgi:hypothetical protein
MAADNAEDELPDEIAAHEVYFDAETEESLETISEAYRRFLFNSPNAAAALQARCSSFKSRPDTEYCAAAADMDADASMGGVAMSTRLDELLMTESGGQSFNSFCPALPDFSNLLETEEKYALRRYPLWYENILPE